MEAKRLNRKHINGVSGEALFQDFPFFDTTLQHPQCSSHDFLEGTIHKSHFMDLTILEESERMSIQLLYLKKFAFENPPKCNFL